MELCKKTAQNESTQYFNASPEESLDIVHEKDVNLSPEEKGKFHLGYILPYISDSINMFLEEMLRESAQNRNFTSGDSQVISVLNKFLAVLDQISSSEELVNLLKDVSNRVRSLNSNYVGPRIDGKLEQLLEVVINQSGSSNTEFKQAIRAIFYSEGQLNPRLEIDPSQSMPVGGFPSGETLEDPVNDDKTMAVPTNVHVSDGDKANFEKIYKTLSQLVDLMDNTSHPSTATFGRLRRDLGKAENSAWSLLYQLKNTQG